MNLGDIISQDGEWRIVTAIDPNTKQASATIPLDTVMANLMTPQEISTDYKIADATVRIALGRGYIKSIVKGNTHLIPRSAADQRWAKTRDGKR